MIKRYSSTAYAIFVFLSLTACAQSVRYSMPRGYNLEKAEIFTVRKVLYEISGICFRAGNPDTVYAIQDEEGKLFYFGLNDHEVNEIKFSSHGDFEDLAIFPDEAFILRSDGMIYSFFLNGINGADRNDITEWKKLLPAGEYESMYADEKENKVYVMCKRCPGDRPKDRTSGFIFKRDKNGNLAENGRFSIDVVRIESIGGEIEKGFHPSAIAKNRATNEWYILSSVNKILVVADANWKAQQVYHLDPSVFNQPEGMTFDKNGNLYISNEGGDKGRGTIIKLAFHK